MNQKEIDELNKRALKISEAEFLFSIIGYHPSSKHKKWAVKSRDHSNYILSYFSTFEDAYSCCKAIDKLIEKETSGNVFITEPNIVITDVPCEYCKKEHSVSYDDELFKELNISFCSQECFNKYKNKEDQYFNYLKGKCCNIPEIKKKIKPKLALIKRPDNNSLKPT